MVQKIFFAVTGMLTISLILILNGNVLIPHNPLPPLGTFLNPFGGVWKSNTDSEKGNSTLILAQLKDKVEVIYDDRRVPHIYAQNLDDALFAQGYVEAQNRLFQMHFLSMAAAGELSSIFGNRTLEIDLEKRRRGMKYAAENAVKGWEKHPAFQSVTTYIQGVNAYISQLKPEDYPFEFKLFGLAPQEWTPLQTALIFKQMSLTLAGRNDDIENTNLLAQLGAEDFSFLYPEHQEVENPIIPTEKPYKFDTLYGQKEDPSAIVKSQILKKFYSNRNKGIGSNSWGVSGSKTESGSPIFCNDPHLSLGLPSIWFEVHIHTPEINAYGVSFPGFPGIMIGFNDYIAWGETNVGQDVEDLFLIKWADSTKTTYLLDGNKMNAETRIEEIKIKGAPSVFDTVKYTHWGPVYETSDDGNYDIAMRWLCHDEPKTDEFNTFVNAMTCKNYSDYLKATEGYVSPAQNFGFAAVDGDIALRVNGRFPAKYSGDGRFLEQGDKQANGWEEFIPKSQNPQIINPKRGYISSANQVSADKTYPYYFTGKFERYRNRSVNEKLDTMINISVADMQNMQSDALSIKSRDCIKVLRKMFNLEEINDNNVLKILDQWDNIYAADQIAPTYFDIFYSKLVENTWDELITWRKDMDLILPESWRLFEIMKTDPNNKFFDLSSTPQKEDAKAIVIKSLKDADASIKQREVKGLSNKWGEYKPLHIYHLTRIPALSEMDISANGCPDAINATGYSFGPSWRMIVSLEEKVKAYAVYPGGQSGNPNSKFYKNMIDKWVKGEYYTLNNHAEAEELRKNSTQSLLLSPN